MAAWAFFYDSEEDVEMVYRYDSRNDLVAEFDRINYNCAKYNQQRYEAIEIDEETASGLINGHEMLHGTLGDLWYVN